MSAIETMPRRSHLAILLMMVLAHAGLFLLLMMRPAPLTVTEPPGAVMLSIYDGMAMIPVTVAPSTSPATAKPVSPELDIKPRSPPPDPLDKLPTQDPEEPAAEAMASLLTQISTAGGTPSSPQAFTIGETCQLSEWIAWSLQSDPTVMVALNAIPRSGRSIANAIMLWDGHWVQNQWLMPTVTDPIRRNIAESIKSAPPQCLDAPIQGPLFLVVQDQYGTTLVTIGTGIWRWADLAQIGQISPQI